MLYTKLACTNKRHFYIVAFQVIFKCCVIAEVTLVSGFKLLSSHPRLGSHVGSGSTRPLLKVGERSRFPVLNQTINVSTSPG